MGNLCRLAHKGGIRAQHRLSIEQIFWRREAARARAKKRELRKSAPTLRKVRLRNLLIDAESKGQEDRSR